MEIELIRHFATEGNLEMQADGRDSFSGSRAGCL